MHDGGPLAKRSAKTTVWSQFEATARLYPDRPALEDGSRTSTYGSLCDRALRLAGALRERGVERGARVAMLSENRSEYLELFLAAARLGASVACQNARLAPGELAHCLDLVEPAVVIVSPRHADKLAGLGRKGPAPIPLGPEYEKWLDASAPDSAPHEIDPEDALLILYTSGTTGLPKGAVISHRAELARNLVLHAEYRIAADDAFVAWSPLFHMGAAEFSLGTLLSGGSVILVDGFERARLAEIVATRKLGWLLLMPGMVGPFAEELRAKNVRPLGVKLCGVMADLVPKNEIAEITRLLNAPYANTFGATETGCPPGSASPIPVGVSPERLSKVQSAFCEVRLVDAEDRDVPNGTPGELCLRGPTLFSGYFRADDVNAHEFRGGWFHMGDVFVRNADGSLDFVDRVKYSIKSGGENVYPAEIERVLLAHPQVLDAGVVKKRDAKWGEVPVAFVARRDEALGESELFERCRRELAGYKQPKQIVFISFDEFPRSSSGKVQRHELEKLLPTKAGEP
jgi:fatty-acyl-CoA synthase